MQQGYFTMSPSCLAVVEDVDVPKCKAPLDTSLNRVKIAYVGADTIAVTYELRDSFAMLLGVGPIGPAVNGSVMLVRQPNGGFQMTWQRDYYPSMALIHSKGGVNTLLLARPEVGGPAAMIDRMNIGDSGTACVVP
jgi:hypothetical protein